MTSLLNYKQKKSATKELIADFLIHFEELNN